MFTKRMDSGWRNILRKVPSGCVLYLPALPEGFSVATISDYTNNANHGTLDTVTWGRLPSGVIYMELDGANSLIDCGSGSSLDDLTEITYMCWVKPDSAGEGNNGSIFVKANNKKVFNVEGATRPLHAYIDAATTDGVAYSNEVLSTTSWSHVVMTYSNSGDRKIYFTINGVAATYSSQVACNGALVSDATGSLAIGNRSNKDWTWDGKIALPRVYNIVLNTTQIASHYNRERRLFEV